jgi:hypothetical protein
MINFLTMKEAATLTGKSPSSIRRIIYPIIHDDKHADRKHVRPTVEEVKQLRTKGENFPWQVSEELLRREVPIGEASSKPHSTTHGSSAATGSDALVDMLRRELDIKNQQITQQMDLINGLSERLREGNILIGSLQQHLALPDGKNRAKEVVEAATPAGESSDKKNSSGWFGRLFRAA